MESSPESMSSAVATQKAHFDVEVWTELGRRIVGKDR